MARRSDYEEIIGAMVAARQKLRELRHESMYRRRMSSEQGQQVTLQFKNSSNVQSARLDVASGIVEVEFGNGSKYTFPNFTAELMKQWEEAKSAGSWFAENVKKKTKEHPATLVTPARVPAPEKPSQPPAPATEAPAAAATPSPSSDLVNVDGCDLETVKEAEILYSAYVKNSGGKAWDGRPCPAWKDLGNPVQSHWCAVVHQVRRDLPRLSAQDRQPLVLEIEDLKKKLQQSQGYSSHSLDQAVLDRTKAIDEECGALRARVTDLEGQISRGDFRPWQKKS